MNLQNEIVKILEKFCDDCDDSYNSMGIGKYQDVKSQALSALTDLLIKRLEGMKKRVLKRSNPINILIDSYNQALLDAIAMLKENSHK